MNGPKCVIFRATVIEHASVYYKDDGGLSKEICLDEEAETRDSYSSALPECCACEEAKYELTFERLWSRNTHPKDFPTNVYTTRFSDIIGATHKYNYRCSGSTVFQLKAKFPDGENAMLMIRMISAFGVAEWRHRTV